MPRSTLYGPGRDQEHIRAVFGWPDTLEVKDNFAPYVELTLMPGWRVRLVGCWLNCWQEPVGGDLVCDIKYSEDNWSTERDSRSWASVFGADHPTISDGMIQNEGVNTVFAASPFELRNVWEPEGETVKILFRADVLEVGEDEPGKGLVLTLEMQMLIDY